MSGIRDPLLEYFMGESAAKDIKLKKQADIIAKLQLQHMQLRTEFAQLYNLHDRIEERVRMYQSMLRRSRDRVIRLEDHLSFYTGATERHIIHIHDSDSDVMSLASDSDSS